MTYNQGLNDGRALTALTSSPLYSVLNACLLYRKNGQYHGTEFLAILLTRSLRLNNKPLPDISYCSSQTGTNSIFLHLPPNLRKFGCWASRPNNHVWSCPNIRMNYLSQNLFPQLPQLEELDIPCP